jgi:hypothetical protein
MRSPRLARTAIVATLFVAAVLGSDLPSAAAGGGVVGGGGIEAQASGWQVHAGGRHGANPCHWLTKAEVAADPTITNLAGSANYDAAWRQWGGNDEGHTDITRLQGGVAPNLLQLVPLLKHCGAQPDTWIVIGIFNVPGLALAFPADLELRWLKAPVLSFAPKDPDFGWTYVQVPVDIRTSPVQWRTYSVTAENGAPVPYYQYVTVTATPKQFTFSPGDGSPEVTCVGNDPIAGFDPGAPGACSTVFKHESSTAANGRSFAVHGQITWSVTYVSSAGPGVLRDVTLGTDGNIEVAAIKALVGCTAGC